jgi:hypothetical protein
MASVKRCAWLAIRLSFFVLAPMCTLCWFAFVGLVVYKVRESGLPFSDFVLAVPTEFWTNLISASFAVLCLVIVGVASSAVVGATIGAVSAGFSRLFRPVARIA